MWTGRCARSGGRLWFAAGVWKDNVDAFAHHLFQWPCACPCACTVGMYLPFATVACPNRSAQVRIDASMGCSSSKPPARVGRRWLTDEGTLSSLSEDFEL